MKIDKLRIVHRIDGRTIELAINLTINANRISARRVLKLKDFSSRVIVCDDQRPRMIVPVSITHIDLTLVFFKGMNGSKRRSLSNGMGTNLDKTWLYIAPDPKGKNERACYQCDD